MWLFGEVAVAVSHVLLKAWLAIGVALDFGMGIPLSDVEVVQMLVFLTDGTDLFGSAFLSRVQRGHGG